MIRNLAFSVLAIGLLAAPALADEAAPVSKRDDAPAVVTLPDARPERLSTRDRWRGGPYVRASAAENERLRSEALDRALPVQSPLATAFGVENERLRSEALDKALPIGNPAFASGTGGVFGLESEQIRAQALDKALPISIPSFATGYGVSGF